MKLDDVASKQVLTHPDKHVYDKDLKNKAILGMSFSGVKVSQIEDATGFDYKKIVKIMHGDTSVSKEDYKKIFDYFESFE